MPYQTLLSGLQPLRPSWGDRGLLWQGLELGSPRPLCPVAAPPRLRLLSLCPKEDGYLRKHWAKPWPAAQLEALRQLARQCRDNGLAFGVGLSPMGAHHDYARQRPALLEKVRLIEEELKPDILAVLFDDMKGIPRISLTGSSPSPTTSRPTPAQAACSSVPATTRRTPCWRRCSAPCRPTICRIWGRGWTSASIFWTGPKVCSSDYPAAHLKQVAEWLHRKPFLWDNYPVNDGSKQGQQLPAPARLREPPGGTRRADLGPRGQPHETGGAVGVAAGHPAHELQARQAVRSGQGAARLLNATCGPQISAMIQADLPLFQDIGLAQLTPEQVAHLLPATCRFATNPASARSCAGWMANTYSTRTA